MGSNSIRLSNQFRKTAENSVDEILLSRVSLQLDGRDPILTEVEMTLPMDVTCLIESDNPVHAGEFLRLMAGVRPPNRGSVLWNQKNYFADGEDATLNPHSIMSCYFEGQRPNPNQTVRQYWSDALTVLYTAPHAVVDAELATEIALMVKTEVEDLILHFDAIELAQVKLSRAPYGFQKLAQLVAIMLKRPQLLILEDPAYGLTEAHWLDFMDFIQLLQRQGFVRHIYMTNTHPTALLHLAVQKIFLADGLLYIDEANPLKKVSHF